MILKKMVVENFRLLKNFELNLKNELSLIIGKNNCGKTSTLIIIDKMLNSSKTITWEDINLDKQEELYNKIIKYDIDSQKSLDFLEAIKLQLYIEYSDKDSYSNIQKFMMDLDPKNNIIILEFVSLIYTKKILVLQQIIKKKSINDFKAFSKYISKNFGDFFDIKKYSRGFDIESNKTTGEISDEIHNRDIQKVIKFTGIRADRAVSNDNGNRVLSKLTSRYYDSYKNTNNESEIIFDKLETELENTDKLLNKIYNEEKIEGKENSGGIFRKVIDVIKKYGGIDNKTTISIESSISKENVLSDNNTKLYYKQGNDHLLPETHNGLGYLNLIGILFEIETKIQELYQDPADINILYIEEPEAHTHPQLQYIFIRNIKDHINEHKKMLPQRKNLQMMITSHSAHIVSECEFEDIIYLRKMKNCIESKNFDLLKKEYDNYEDKMFKFVKKYLILNKSELFFADKVICIEGDTERIVMPTMMKKVDKEVGFEDGAIPLLSQNISIIEVGSHSHTFKPLFLFLGIKVLIITDIDSVKMEEIVDKNNNKKNVYKSCHPKEGTHTSNISIKKFFEEDNLSNGTNQFEELINKKPENKIKNNIKIAYSIPEINEKYRPRSFEDAFISLNISFILENKEGFYEYGALKKIDENNIENDFYTFANNIIEKKPAFASSLLYFDGDGENNKTWKVPHYIKEGLLWIRKN